MAQWAAAHTELLTSSKGKLARRCRRSWTKWTMTEITVRVLDESEWSVYPRRSLRALAESPGSFTATLWDRQRASGRLCSELRVRHHRLPRPITRLRPRSGRGDCHGVVAGARRYLGADSD